ncbi:hypothetical protein [Hyalangium minutum]|uniref:Lipoprotein n=1 Tax=Hyalangium minutum TaxID=394096 RepID=A0A085WN61_9BACT|nr:hypothetical protein [Hyalangium minutum]KFE69124.1 hypothetical protein DB31_7026 [Hyalangium minutum]
MNRLLLCAAVSLLSGCELSGLEQEEEVPPEWPQYYCGFELIDLKQVKSTNPGHGNQRLDRGTTCWVIDFDEDPQTLSGTVTLQRQMGTTSDGRPVGCTFKGLSNQVRAELTEGTCLIPTETGFARFELTTPASFNPRAATGSQAVLDGTWFEQRGQDFIRSKATYGLYPQSQAQKATVDGYPESAKKILSFANDWPGCGASRCFKVAFGGKGQLVESDSNHCASVLGWFPDPFAVVIDQRGHLAFADNAASVEEENWLAGGPSLTGCGSFAFTGERPSPYSTYEVKWNAAGAGEMSMDHTIFHTQNNLTKICRTRWKTELTACD